LQEVCECGCRRLSYPFWFWLRPWPWSYVCGLESTTALCLSGW